MTKIFDPHQIKLYQPPADSHKGRNGKLLVIGGSKLFHSSIFWAADVASRIVDLVHLTSPANENNQIFRQRLKEKFWNGIVVDWADVESYIQEDDCVLIGPGMMRNKVSQTQNLNLKTAGETDCTSFIVNYLLKKYPSKRWVIDGGGLQEVDVRLISKSCILTPHFGEFQKLWNKFQISNLKAQNQNLKLKATRTLSEKLNNATILLKGPTDIVCQGDRRVEISGGNSGMTKGGTGDVLAGLVAGLYCKNDAWTAATAASWVNKKAGDQLYKKVGPYFNAADLVEEVPKVLSSPKPRPTPGRWSPESASV